MACTQNTYYSIIYMSAEWAMPLTPGSLHGIIPSREDYHTTVRATSALKTSNFEARLQVRKAMDSSLCNKWRPDPPP